MIQFFSPDIAQTLTLSEEDSAHCCRVLRMKEGDRIQVVDGRGNVYQCVITGAHQKHTTVEIVSEEYRPNHWPCRITIAVAPTKNMDRMEWMVEKAVEIGVDRIVMLQCRHSERKVVKIDRLRKIAISAMKQSLKSVLPEVDELTDFRRFVDEAAASDSQMFMGYCDANFPRVEFVDDYVAGGDVVVMIGPEGDFSPEEVAYAVDKGVKPVTFGESRLRTETAGLYAVEAVHIVNQLKLNK